MFHFDLPLVDKEAESTSVEELTPMMHLVSPPPVRHPLHLMIAMPAYYKQSMRGASLNLRTLRTLQMITEISWMI
ncbi:hypothetical protein HOLleu_31984 [Holothuria leucospilota]|uniref:Uncharacterized protein n=1 Tax=Holothuria leucospilota TaxID=206669 RepID=A0A9Q1BI09_HOLLE|nr:hypothetical protein HOLleu_31984 [Holothuria leucospilota]